MSDPFSLQGRGALVTGGTRGIGRAIALQFAAAGATVLANYVRDEAAAETLAAEAGARGWSVRTVRGDATSDTGQQRILEAVGTLGVPLSIVVHAAATGVHRPVAELTARHFDWTFGLNVRAFLQLVVKLLPQLGPGSSILSLSSAGAVRAVPQYTLVGASKGALESMTRHLAVELAPRGIRVNAIAPGTVLTDAWNAMPDKERRLEEARQRAPQGRLTTVEEVARAAQFLVSDAAAGIAGHTLVVDGAAGVVV